MLRHFEGDLTGQFKRPINGACRNPGLLRDFVNRLTGLRRRKQRLVTKLNGYSIARPIQSICLVRSCAIGSDIFRFRVDSNLVKINIRVAVGLNRIR